MWRALLGIALGGCHVIFSLEPTPAPDATPDAPFDADSSCYGHPDSMVRICLDAEPLDTVQLLDAFNTDEGCDPVRTTGSTPDVCVRVGKQVTLTNAVVTGSRPLVIVATQSIIVSGLDIAAHAENPGPGAMTCAPGANAMDTLYAGAGGAGGSHADQGARGGDVQTTGGGEPGPAVTPDLFVGGCNGGTGGRATEDTSAGGPAGLGGGAVAMITRGNLTILAGTKMNASGGGGFGGGASGGGGGGGAGGTIVLDAPALDVAGQVFAIGGGGGEGAKMIGVGNTGADPTGPNTPPTGGGGTGGSPGGTGAYGSTPASPGLTNGSTVIGGGGGGGGFGVIWMFPPRTVGANVSPRPINSPR